MHLKLQSLLLSFALCILTMAQAPAQGILAGGVVTDWGGNPLPGVSILIQGTTRGTLTGTDGSFTISSQAGAVLQFSCLGFAPQEAAAAQGMRIVLQEDSRFLEESVVTALGIKRERKALGYAVEDIKADELMRGKSASTLNALAGKVAGLTITQASGSAGAGAQITLRGGTSLERDNQPLFVVDGIIYDNSAGVLGNSDFDGAMNTATTASNRVMDINPEDIESLSVLKGPAAAALYGSRASAGVLIINTKKGKEGSVEVNFSSKYTRSWASSLPETQQKYVRGYSEDLYDANTKEYAGTRFVSDIYKEGAYGSWGAAAAEGTPFYDNIGAFFQSGSSLDNSLSVSGGAKGGNFFISAAHFDQTGIIPGTGYSKTTFRFNGEQKWNIFTFTANTAYSQAHTDKTLTSAGLHGNNGQGTMRSLYTWAPSDDITVWQNPDGTRYSPFGTQVKAWEDKSNPLWVVNKDRLKDATERFTGSMNVRADITPWWWVGFRAGIDTYLSEDSKLLAAGGTNNQEWQNGMYSENSRRYHYLSTNLMSDLTLLDGEHFRGWNLDLLLGTATDQTHVVTDSRKAWNFQAPEFYAFDNAVSENRDFRNTKSLKRLVGVYGELRANWKSTVFVTLTGRNDWSSTLPVENRSYFYPSVSGSFVFTQLLQDKGILRDDILSFGKIRASWARVGKDADPYATNTNLWPVGTYLGGFVSMGNFWFNGNPYLKPEITQSTELGLELRLFRGRLRLDYAWYTNDSYNQIMRPRLSNAVGYVERSVNAGDVLNKGMEFTLGGIPVSTRIFSWNTSLNLYGNRGKVENLLEGVDILYVTDVQVGNAKAASFNGGSFMGISGSKWKRDDAGNILLDGNGMPQSDGATTYEIGNREPLLSGGWNNSFRYKNWELNMLWDFRVGGDVYNGTLYEMVKAGTAKITEKRETLTVTGVQDGQMTTRTYNAAETYTYNNKTVSGTWIISNYWQNIYPAECAHFITSVNSLRLRNISLSWNLPSRALAWSGGIVKDCVLTAAASNVLLFTNYCGDPEVSAAGAGAIGSSSVGIDWCCVPAIAGVSFGVNLKF